jgi:succinate-semialdehyde dehydrogenase/glutarate-semialdehyde dehydrogenase
MKAQILFSLNPSKAYELIGEVPITSHARIRECVQLARQAQPAWAAIGFEGRKLFLEKIYDAFVQNKDRIAALIAREMGMPVSVCKQIDIDSGLNYLRGYLDKAEQWLAPEISHEDTKEIHYMFFEPLGVAGVSVPWNYPFSNFIWAVMQNLVVGNTIVMKHSEECPLTGKLFETILASTDLPEGVFNEVYGDGADTGEYLMNSAIDLVWFTGSTGVGKHLYLTAAKKFIPALLELGGSAPGIVCADADPESTVKSIYFNRFLNSGQTCDGLKRLIVHKSLVEEVTDRLKALVQTKKIGPAEDPATDIGPLAAERQLISLEEQVADALAKGAKVIMGAQRPKHVRGAYYEPTILTHITQDMKVWKEEVFGPVLPIVSFDSLDQAIALANDTIYGLGAYVYSRDNDQALHIARAIKTGNVSINNASYVIPENPFGGVKDSGLGREHGRDGLRELCSVKTVAMKK